MPARTRCRNACVSVRLIGSLVATAQVTFVEDDEQLVEQHRFTLVEGPDGTLLMDEDIAV